ncbi:hypothetical protein [Candidatus Paracaedibacter symbiosus]|uniref:hypothetical protein n=1 Tax=Candidatus Paracaedibacter symbiosus TaxID=244582 RepID=UPI0012EC26D3|nr:hypothetical protein [Candidatus Paracaedibacter symbiosus]
MTTPRILQAFPYIIISVGMMLSLGFFTTNVSLVIMAILGFGLTSGLVYGPIISQALSTIEPHDVDLASSLVIFCRLMGSCSFIAMASWLYFTEVAYFAFFIGAVCCLISLLLAMRKPVTVQLT